MRGYSSVSSSFSINDTFIIKEGLIELVFGYHLRILISSHFNICTAWRGVWRVQTVWACDSAWHYQVTIGRYNKAYPSQVEMTTSLLRAVETSRSLTGMGGIRVGEVGPQTLGSASTSTPSSEISLSSVFSWEEGLHTIDSAMRSASSGSEESTGSSVSDWLGASCDWSARLFSGWMCEVLGLKSNWGSLLEHDSVFGEVCTVWLPSGLIRGALGVCGRGSAGCWGVDTGNTLERFREGVQGRGEAREAVFGLPCLLGVVNLEHCGEETALIRDDRLRKPENKIEWTNEWIDKDIFQS